jgi:TPR repeat protein
MDTDPPSTKEGARDYAISQMDASDPAAQLVTHDRDTKAARELLTQRLKAQPQDAMATYELGCILTAESEFGVAMDRFADARRQNPTPELRRQIQRQQRRICGIWTHLAKSGDAGAMAALGAAYEQGRGVATILEEAKHWYLDAANAGNAEAMCRLASMYEHMVGATVRTDKAEQWYRNQALEWYRKSAGLGNAEAKQWLTNHDH